MKVMEIEMLLIGNTFCGFSKPITKLSKYAIEGVYLLTSVKCMLTHQVYERVIWGRGTNKKGKIGVNMPNDLEMEHTIKSTKNLITSMGANKTEKAVLHSSIAVTGVSESLEWNSVQFNL